jgi:hypothetical protein
MRMYLSNAALPALLLGASLLCVGSAQAAVSRECDGLSFPRRIEAKGDTLTLNGLGLRKATFLGIKVYVGALYVAHPSADAEAILSSPDPIELRLRFVLGVSAGELRDAWHEGFKKSAAAALPRLQSRIAQLDAWMRGVKSGQQMTFLRIPGVGIEYALDGRPLGTIQGDDFARSFLAIWLGSSPPSRALRAGLLGGPCD